jgi:hypothetical protein
VDAMCEAKVELGARAAKQICFYSPEFLARRHVLGSSFLRTIELSSVMVAVMLGRRWCCRVVL